MAEHSPLDDGPPTRDAVPTDGLRTTVDTVVAAGQLLADPRKCRVWHECWLRDGLDVQRLADTVSIPQSTLYNLTKEMVAEGSLYESGNESGRSTVYRPVSMQVFVSEHPEGIGPQFNIHGTLIGIVGVGVNTDDIETFLDRNNYTLLVETITAVLALLADDDPPESSADELLGHLRPVDARMVQGHVAAVLRRECEHGALDWTFPEDPVIEPVEPNRL